MSTTRLGATAAGRSRAQTLARRVGTDLRIGRSAAGLSQEAVARRAGVSQSSVSRVELGVMPIDLEVLCRAAAAIGHDVGCRVFPVRGVRLRDSGQLGIAQALVSDLHAAWRPTMESPVSTNPHDGRAVDLLLEHRDEVVACEIERWLVDFQAQLRAHQLKRAALAERFDRPVRLLLVIRDTTGNRSAVADHDRLLKDAGFASSRRVWQALRTGLPLGTDGILWTRAR